MLQLAYYVLRRFLISVQNFFHFSGTNTGTNTSLVSTDAYSSQIL